MLKKFVKVAIDVKVSKKHMPYGVLELLYEEIKPMLLVTILVGRIALRAMMEEMYLELPDREL